MMTNDPKRLETPQSFIRCESYYIGSCRVEDFKTCQECRKAMFPKA
jgi:hypothetical protein